MTYNLMSMFLMEFYIIADTKALISSLNYKGLKLLFNILQLFQLPNHGPPKSVVKSSKISITWIVTVEHFRGMKTRSTNN